MYSRILFDFFQLLLVHLFGIRFIPLRRLLHRFSQNAPCFWPETRRILTEAMKETTEWNETYAEQMNKEQLEEIKKNSAIHIYELSDKEKQEWMKRLDPVYRQYEPIFGFLVFAPSRSVHQS